MKYILEKQKRVPAYQQLYRQLREDIVTGAYAYGTKLPSKRLVAEETGISVVTVEHAYALLCDEGYVEARERSGYYVVFSTEGGFQNPENPRPLPVEHPARRGTAGREIPFSVLAKTMRGVIGDRGEGILDRSPNCGCDELREAIRQYLARSRGIHADREQIIIGSGSEYLYTLLLELLGREKVYGIESPSYKKIGQIYSLAGVRYEMLPLGGDGIDSEALWSSHADILHITPYRSFPSGVTATASKRHEYLRWAVGGKYIVEDDFESEFSVSRKPEETLFSHSEGDNIIYMNTFSMTVSPSLRVGYMVLPRCLVPVFWEKLGFFSCTVPTFIQYVLAELIRNGDFERHINRVRRKKRKEQNETGTRG